jgi:hypothetical protein
MSDPTQEQPGPAGRQAAEVSRRSFLQLAGASGVLAGAGLAHVPAGPAEAAVTGNSLQGMAEVSGFGVSPERLKELSGPAQGILSAIAELRRLDIPEVDPVTVYRVPRA